LSKSKQGLFEKAEGQICKDKEAKICRWLEATCFEETLIARQQ